MKFPFLFLIFILLVVPLVSAQNSDTILVSFNQEFDLTRSCENNGTYCSSSAVCNVTLTAPDGVNIFDNELMTNQISFHNKTIIPGTLNQFGFYPAVMTCFDSGGQLTGNGFDTFQLQVTGDGQQSNAFPIELSILILGFILIMVGKVKDELSLFQTLGSMIVLTMGVVTLYPGYAGLNFSNLQGQVLGASSIGFGAYFMIEKYFSRGEQEQSFNQEPFDPQEIEDEEDGRFHG